MNAPFRLGISPCPNDTYTFFGLLTNLVSLESGPLVITLLDIQELNHGLRSRQFDAAKGSYFAAMGIAKDICVLPIGSALGFGVGPILLRGRHCTQEVPDNKSRVLVPGPETTAFLLLRALHPEARNVQHVVFSDIIPALLRGEADFGVCIHEGRFTYEQAGLTLADDLGQRYETLTGCPLPLGGIFAHRETSPESKSALVHAVSKSLTLAAEDPEGAVRLMRRHAAELSDEALWKHVELYVNAETRALSSDGRAAIRALETVARTCGLIASDAPHLSFFSSPESP